MSGQVVQDLFLCDNDITERVKCDPCYVFYLSCLKYLDTRLMRQYGLSWSDFFVLSTVGFCWNSKTPRSGRPHRQCQSVLLSATLYKCSFLQPFLPFLPSPNAQVRNPFSRAISAYEYAIKKWSNESGHCIPPTFEEFCRLKITLHGSRRLEMNLKVIVNPNFLIMSFAKLSTILISYAIPVCSFQQGSSDARPGCTKAS